MNLGSLLMTDSDTQFVRPLPVMMAMPALLQLFASRVMLPKFSDQSEKSTRTALSSLALTSILVFTCIVACVFTFST